MNKQNKLQLYYQLSVVYKRPNNNILVSHYRVRPFDLSGRLKHFERLIDEGEVLSFMVETIFDY